MADSWFQVVLEGFQRQMQAILAAFAVLFVTNTPLSSVCRTWLAPANVCNVTSYTNRERILQDCEKIRIFFSQIAVDALDKINDGGGLVFLPEVFDDCLPFGVLSSISELSRLEKLPE